MRLERLSIGGVLRFTDPVTVDLASLPAGLVAVVGVNGSGKTTLVEAPLAALFRAFPSRDARPLVDYATTRDAFVEAVFTVDTDTYRARVNLDGTRRAADAVLVHTTADGTTTTLNDGKLSTYDEAVARVFPPRDLLLASAVAAQNRAGSFVTLDKRGRKDLFSRLLGLDRYEAMSTTARAAAARCEAVIGALGVQQRLLVPDAAEGVRLAIEAEAQRAADAAAIVARDLAEVAEARPRLQADRDRLRDDASAHASARMRLVSLGSETAALLGRAQALRQASAAAETAANQEIHLLDANLTRQLADLDARLAKNQALLDRADDVRAAAATVRALRVTVATLDSEITASQEAAARWQAQRSDLDRQIQDAVHAHQDIERAQRAASRLAGVCDACTFVADAREAQASLPALQARAATMPALTAASEALDAERAAGKAAHDALIARHRDVQRQLAAAEPDAQLLPRLEDAEARIADLTADRAQAVAHTDGLRAAVAGRRAAALATLADDLRAVDAQIHALGEQVATAEAEATRTAAAADDLRAVTDGLAAMDARWQTLTAEEARLAATAEACASRLAVWREKAAQLADVDRQLAAVSAEWREWTLLAKALGRDGLPVLEIDAAGPTVSAYTNDLLAVCFGPRFTADLITQTAKADGKGTKEVFELQVLDNLRGGDPRDLTDLSGGEQILVDEALKNALALFLNARRTGAVETMWRDETTGPLDPENALRYVDMLRRVREIGHVRHVLFVSHNPAAADLADVQLRLADGQVSVHYPPFAEAA